MRTRVTVASGILLAALSLTLLSGAFAGSTKAEAQTMTIDKHQRVRNFRCPHCSQLYTGPQGLALLVKCSRCKQYFQVGQMPAGPTLGPTGMPGMPAGPVAPGPALRYGYCKIIKTGSLPFMMRVNYTTPDRNWHNGGLTFGQPGQFWLCLDGRIAQITDLKIEIAVSNHGMLEWRFFHEFTQTIISGLRDGIMTFTINQ